MTIDVYISDVKADGSCFFRCLYNSLKNQKLLNRFLLYLDIDYDINEEIFVNLMRCLIRNKILHDNALVEYYLTFREDFIKDKETLRLKLDTSLRKTIFYYIKDILESSDFKNFITLDNFNNVCGDMISQNSTYVCEFEINVMKSILSNIGINLRILNDVEVLRNESFNNNTLYLVNLGEIHYNYIEVVKPVRRKPSTKSRRR